MLQLIVTSLSLFLSSLLVGAMFCVWLVFNPSQLDASHYIILQQQGIRTLHPTLPALGALTILSTLACIALARNDTARMSLLVGTAVLFIASGLITRFANMPINAIVAGWNSSAAPEHWTALRDAWWRWHSIRLCTALGGMILLIMATLMREPSTVLSVAAAICRSLGVVLMRTVILLM